MNTVPTNAGRRDATKRFPIIGNRWAAIFQWLETGLLAIALLASWPARAGDAFVDAEMAYKAGRFADAAALYRQILDEGRVAPELFFNLGNACFKQGDVGEAVLNYRRAWMLAPRDPDIRANLRFAMQRAGAAGPDLSLPARVLLRLSRAECATVAIAGYWLTAGLAILYLRRRQPALLKGAAAAGAVAAAGLVGILQWRALEAEPELVIKARTQALFAPLADGTPHFALPEGSIVRELDRTGDWVRLRSGAESGWVPAKSVTRVLAWKNGKGE